MDLGKEPACSIKLLPREAASTIPAIIMSMYTPTRQYADLCTSSCALNARVLVGMEPVCPWNSNSQLA